MYCPMFTLSRTMPSVFTIRHWPIIGFGRFFVLFRICIVTSVALIPVDIIRSQVKHRKFSRHLLSPAGGGDGIRLVACVKFILPIPAAPLHPELQCTISAIVLCRDIWENVSNRRLLKPPFGSISNASRFAPVLFYRSAWQRPYPINNRQFVIWMITLRPQILIR